MPITPKERANTSYQELISSRRLMSSCSYIYIILTAATGHAIVASFPGFALVLRLTLTLTSFYVAIGLSTRVKPGNEANAIAESLATRD